MKSLFSVCVAVLFVIGAVAAVQAADNLVLATGGTAGTYYPFGGAMAKIWNSKIKDMNVTAQTSGASRERPPDQQERGRAGPGPERHPGLRLQRQGGLQGTPQRHDRHRNTLP